MSLLIGKSDSYSAFPVINAKNSHNYYEESDAMTLGAPRRINPRKNAEKTKTVTIITSRMGLAYHEHFVGVLRFPEDSRKI